MKLFINLQIDIGIFNFISNSSKVNFNREKTSFLRLKMHLEHRKLDILILLICSIRQVVTWN